MNREEILAQAKTCVCGDREQDYGNPENTFDIIARLWATYLRGKRSNSSNGDIYIYPEDVANMMALLKIARIATGRFKEDSYIDACGYMACAAECAGGRNDCTD